VTTQLLLQNQVDIGDAIKPFYRVAAGDQLTALSCCLTAGWHPAAGCCLTKEYTLDLAEETGERSLNRPLLGFWLCLEKQRAWPVVAAGSWACG